MEQYMTTTWYHLEHGKELGPVSGRDLKARADMGRIFPHTPVYRLSDGDRSPWTRAGAIKALFPQDVTELLGPPICDKCGTASEDNRCPKCQPPQFVELTPEEIALPAYKKISEAVEVESKYHYLRGYVGFMKVAAGCILVLGLLLAMVLANSARYDNAFIAAIFSALQYILLMALSEFFVVIMDMEENTRRTEINTRK
jgi:hypothetical protein